MKSIRIRKVIFGIRFKFSLIIILSVALSSTLLIFALINQYENKMKKTLAQQGETILQGISGKAEIYLRARRLLSLENSSPSGKRNIPALVTQREETKKAMSRYFASVVGNDAKKMKDRVLDIAFIIDADWTGIGTDAPGSGRSFFYYFQRHTGALFTQKGGRSDPLLEPTILDHFRKVIDTKSHTGFASITDVEKQYRYLFKDNPDFVVVALPLFKDTPALYDEYIHFKKKTVTRATIGQHLKRKSEFPILFISRIISLGSFIDYRIDLSSLSHRRMVLNYFIAKTLAAGSMNADIVRLKEKFESLISHNMQGTTIQIAKLESAWKMIRNNYRIPTLTKHQEIEIRQDFLNRLIYYRVPISADLSLDELSLISFRADIAGFIGLFFYRKEYFPEMRKSTNEIINLAMSIVLRAAFLALLFPAFIIKSIRTLADRAIEIGKGSFNKTIVIPGSDEIGRLADIFNIMTANLMKAEEIKIEKIRMENELLTARQIQSALLPERIPDIAGVEFGAYYLAQTESGGDYYDAIDLGENKIGIAIADVSGHGVGSGLVMAMTRTLLHIYCKKTENTKKIFELINDYLKHNTARNYFVTMFYGILDMTSLTLTYSSAGHSPAMIMRNETLREIPAGGIALGVAIPEMFSKLTEIREVRLQKNDYFVLYTDGVDESMDASGNEYGLERFQKALLLNYGKHPEKIINAVINDIRNFTGTTPQHDDITMILLKINRH